MERIFCACAPGLEALLADELAALGLAASPTPGGAEAAGEHAAARACLASRLADAVKVRVDRGRGRVSRDAAGAPLFRRGWRARVGAAPLRETLAAGLLRFAGWDGEVPLVDPMCGSGTIAIEAALVAARRAPGLAAPGAPPRRFAFERWPGHDRAATERLRARLAAAERTPPAPLHASDRNAGALRLAQKNADAAGAAAWIRFARADAAAIALPPGPGLLAVNPPYGERLEDARPAWHALADLLDRAPGWSAVVLAPRGGLLRLLRRDPLRTLPVKNGGMSCDIALFRG
jgi:putative N6-adenine-specific DNA methylase